MAVTDKYILVDGEPVKEPDVLTWAKWFENVSDRTVARTDVGDAHVSTVFLGMDYRFGVDEGPPVLWETMVFGGPLNDEQERWTSREEAEKGHAAMVERVKQTNRKNGG